jgi:hypothetical protein
MPKKKKKRQPTSSVLLISIFRKATSILSVLSLPEVPSAWRDDPDVPRQYLPWIQTKPFQAWMLISAACPNALL